MIYVLWAKDTNLYKVGYTKRTVEKRIKELSTGCPYQLVVMGTIKDGTKEQEAEIHKTLKREGKWNNNADGKEWFMLTKEDVTKILNKEPLSPPNKMMNAIEGTFLDIFKDELNKISKRKGIESWGAKAVKNIIKTYK